MVGMWLAPWRAEQGSLRTLSVTVVDGWMYGGLAICYRSIRQDRRLSVGIGELDDGG